jgi:formamidopyrimidine-DNA glycosylase
MPELPEVEVTRLSFVDRITGAKIQKARLGKPLRWPLGCEVKDLESMQVKGVGRRGKYLLVDLDGGLLLIHLGMSGRLSFDDLQSQPPNLASESLTEKLSDKNKHIHFELTTSQGVLRLHDPRRFGAVVFVAGQESPVAKKLLGGLGIEPLGGDFDALQFYQSLQKRSAPIKQVLLAGDVVVGVGNIYASECLFLAGIRPTVAANQLSKPRVLKLRDAIVQVLSKAVALGGSTLKDFANAHGDDGHFQLQADVYARAGQACHACLTPIKQLRQGQRSTFYCPKCQKF